MSVPRNSHPPPTRKDCQGPAGPLWIMTPYVLLYLALGCLMGGVLFLHRRAHTHRGVSPSSSDSESLYDFFLDAVLTAGWDVEEVELLDGKGIEARPGAGDRSRHLVRGICLSALGLIPGMVWFAMGRSRLAVTIKPQSGFLVVIVETSGRPAEQLWRRINLRLTRRTLASS